MQYFIGVILLAWLTISSPSYALFDVQLLGGYRAAKYELPDESTDMSGFYVEGAFHLSPVPLLPVGVGLGIQYVSYSDIENFESLKEASGIVFIPEINVWLPIDLVSLTPFAKLGYSFGSLDFKGDNSSELTSDLSGIRIAAGVKWQPRYVPLLKVVLQADYSIDQLRAKEAKTGGLAVTLSEDWTEDRDFGSFALAVGLELGI